jgi:hypothetical protein
MLRKWFSKALSFVAAAVLLVLAACGEGVYGDRNATTTDNIRVDSVRIIPFGSRFVLADAPTRLMFIGFNTGYECSEILRLELSSIPSGSPAAFRPDTRVRLPAVPDCALDSGGRDTTVTHVFGADLGFARIANSSGKVTDSTRVVRGAFARDSIVGVPGIAGTVSKGAWTFRDSSSIASRMLFGDSLSSCRYVNHASYFRSKDTIRVRFSYVTLDPSASPDSCRGEAHSDSAAPAAYREEK